MTSVSAHRYNYASADFVVDTMVAFKSIHRYRLSAYYWARVGADLPLELALPSLFVVIIYWLGGLRWTAAAFFSNWAAMMLIVTLAQSWGLLIGGVCMDPKQAQTVTTVIMLTFLLVGGFYVADVPVWIGWIKYFSFVYWGECRGLRVRVRLCNLASSVCQIACLSDIESQISTPPSPSDLV